MSDTVVVGWIDSAEGRAAIAAAVQETRRRNGRLIVVHSARGDDEDADDIRKVRDALAQLKEQLSSTGLDITTLDFGRGNDPAGDLIDVADKEDAALIVIGLRRRSPVGKLLLGSNAQDILLRADRPVLAVKAP
jgi:nucleotide-binding universal stress UspA family protein